MDEVVEQRLTTHQCVRDGRVSNSMEGERFILCHEKVCLRDRRGMDCHFIQRLPARPGRTLLQAMGQRGESYVNADHSPPSYTQHKRGETTTTKQRSTMEGVRSVHSLSFKNCLRDLRGMDSFHSFIDCLRDLGEH